MEVHLHEDDRFVLECCEEPTLLLPFFVALREEMRPFEIHVGAIRDGRLIVLARAGNAEAGCDMSIEWIAEDRDSAMKWMASYMRESLGEAMDDKRFRFPRGS